MRRRPSRWIFWIFLALWRLICGFVDVVGRLVAIIVGAVLVVAGLALSATLIGAVVGIPLVLIGGALVACALFRRRRRRRPRW